jgi:molecular chaperone HtpG
MWGRPSRFLLGGLFETGFTPTMINSALYAFSFSEHPSSTPGSSMTSLSTNAEKNADAARSLPGFREFSLPGVRDQVANLLSMIGRAEGIFSTYSKHDFSHIEAMLNMLDWLVPSDTQKAMTPVDWLLVTLGIYFHDLGLLVTSDEYSRRNADPAFLRFMDELRSDPNSRDYISRADKMDPNEKERFFFQEYVRSTHAARIREWITGRHNREWTAPVKAIAEEVAKLVRPLPQRLVENLATVCESHHRENLDRTELYPICQHYGSHVQMTANVQYAAFLLRTADLLHVTRDRTPSEMFRLLKISDPKGIDEWKKQQGTFSVHMKGRELDPNDLSSHVILFNADFSEERPYFALAEYLAYANEQIRLTKRWADASQAQPDARNFWFPWHSVKGDVRVEGNEPVQISFELDRGRLLNLLVGHTIYNDPTVAVRELLQNAIDATRFQAHLDQSSEELGEMGTVDVFWNGESRELIVRDHGIGMDLDIIKNHLMKVGSSFYDTPQFQNRYGDFTPISRFGIGVLACFMISDDVEIITCRTGGGYRIRMTSVQSEYLLKKLDPDNSILDGIGRHGTQVRLIVRDSVDLSRRNIRGILQHWILLPACRVSYMEMGKDPERIGFDSPKHLVEESLSQLSERSSPSMIVTKTYAGDAHQSYELAFQVRGGFTPERDFRSLSSPRVSAVCVEGIRTDSTIPGLEKPGLVGVLSVRGNQKFRTTVSRSTLERDDEYDLVAGYCLEMLFEHLSQEVSRITKKSGHPLSQASTAARWIYQTLQGLTDPKYRDKLRALYHTLPSIVLEHLFPDGKGDPRVLVSEATISELPVFWTVESRLVDSLGIISRDLGRELSLYAFLTTLAPELLDSRLSPIVHDPHLRPEVLANHHVKSAEFSRHHQQTALQWVPRDDVATALVIEFDTEAVHLLVDEPRLFFFRETPIRTPIHGVPGEIIAFAGSVRPTPIYIAPIQGDIDAVRLLKTRVATVADPSTTVAETLCRLTAGIEACPREDIVSLGMLNAAGIVIVWNLVQSKARGDAYSERLYVDKAMLGSIPHLWVELARRTNEILGRFSIPPVSNSLTEIVETDDVWFDASSYWRDWVKKG